MKILQPPILQTASCLLCLLLAPAAWGQTQPASTRPTPEAVTVPPVLEIGGTTPTTRPAQAATAPAEVEPDQTPILQESVRKIMTALDKADGEALMSLTHPRVIDLAGGSLQFEKVLEDSFQEFQRRRLKVEAPTFTDPPIFLKNNEDEFAIVPFTVVMSMEGQRMESKTFQLGARPKGTKVWKFVDGANLNQEMVKRVFPKFPPDYVFPKVEMKRFEN